MDILSNPWRGKGLSPDIVTGAPLPSVDAAAAEAMPGLMPDAP